MRIVALKYGESVFGENYIFKGGRKDVLLPISFTIYLIQTQGKNILVDAGCDDGAGFPMSVFKKPVEVLAECGISPEEITDVVLTHRHHDHVEAVRYYKNAMIYIQEEEYQSARKYIPEDLRVQLFREECTIAENVTVKKIGGHTHGSSIVLAGQYVLCGDECYHAKCLTDGICTGATKNEEKSMAFLAEYSKEKYIPLLLHDPGIMPGKVGAMIVTP
jgi:glyoxylase-like metal-dependent hydrolase (beta-lactamase superfamily II)